MTSSKCFPMILAGILNLSLYRGEQNDEPLIQIPTPEIPPPVVEREIIQPEPQVFTRTVVQESSQELKTVKHFRPV